MDFLQALGLFFGGLGIVAFLVWSVSKMGEAHWSMILSFSITAIILGGIAVMMIRAPFVAVQWEMPGTAAEEQTEQTGE